MKHAHTHGLSTLWVLYVPQPHMQIVCYILLGTMQDVVFVLGVLSQIPILSAGVEKQVPAALSMPSTC